MKKFILCAISVVLLTLSSCGKNESATNTETETTGQLTKVKPQELKNAIQLISDDWMLLAAGDSTDFNEMTISWGSMGELWGKDIMTVFVDTTRYTYKYMQSSDFFTVCGFPEKYHDDLKYLGTHSGRNGNKLADTSLHATFTDNGAPIFSEASVVIECRKIYDHNFDPAAMTGSAKGFYNERGSVHAVFIGEIVNAWMIK